MAQEMKHRSSLKPGFTLIELMIGITIIGILAGGIAYTAMTVMANAGRSSTKTSMQTIKNSLMLYEQEKGEYPKTLRALLDSGILKGGPKVIKDAWGQNFIYRVTSDGKNPYELSSYGPDGKSGGKASRLDAWTTK